MKVIGIIALIVLGIGIAYRALLAVRVWWWANSPKDIGEKISRANAYRQWRRGQRRWFR